MSAITDFYDGTGTDHLGRTRKQILALPLPELEPCHDYIQWLFPLPEPSAYFPGAPLLTEDDATWLARHPLDMLDSLERMLEFYGLPSRDGGKTREGSWARVRQWATPGNHNLLRLTRIMRCLTLCGCTASAEWVLRQLCAVFSIFGQDIGPETLAYWACAVDPDWIPTPRPPD